MFAELVLQRSDISLLSGQLGLDLCFLLIGFLTLRVCQLICLISLHFFLI